MIGKSRRARVGRLVATVAACAAVVVVAAPAASAAESGSTAGKGACGQGASAADLTRGLGAAAQLSATNVASKNGIHLFGAPPTAAQLADGVAQTARKRAMVSSGIAAAGCASNSAAAVASPAYAASATIAGMVQYRQTQWYYCGPAVVAEMSATVPGPSPIGLSQDVVASYTGTTTPNGTYWDQELSGINHFVGVPDWGWNFYTMAWISDPPTAAQSADFDRNLATDVANRSPVAGLAQEVNGGPHLVGHPANQTIGHYIAIGGYNATQVWYADSYVNWGWSGVAPYSWFDKWTMKVILGGAGYIW